MIIDNQNRWKSEISPLFCPFQQCCLCNTLSHITQSDCLLAYHIFQEAQVTRNKMVYAPFISHNSCYLTLNWSWLSQHHGKGLKSLKNCLFFVCHFVWGHTGILNGVIWKGLLHTSTLPADLKCEKLEPFVCNYHLAFHLAKMSTSHNLNAWIHMWCVFIYRCGKRGHQIIACWDGDVKRLKSRLSCNTKLVRVSQNIVWDLDFCNWGHHDM